MGLEIIYEETLMPNDEFIIWIDDEKYLKILFKDSKLEIKDKNENILLIYNILKIYKDSIKIKKKFEILCNNKIFSSDDLIEILNYTKNIKEIKLEIRVDENEKNKIIWFEKPEFEEDYLLNKNSYIVKNKENIDEIVKKIEETLKDKKINDLEKKFKELLEEELKKKK